MTIRPFSEGTNPRDRRRITFLSNSINTSEIDAFRQGVELTQPKHFQMGIAKIWSGLPGHAIEMQEIGQRDDDIFPEAVHFEEVERFDPQLYVSDYYTNQIVVIDSAVSVNEGSFDGIIEPLTIRRVISFTSIDSPFEAHSVKGSLESGNWDPYRNADQIISKYDFTERNLGSSWYEDNVDMTGRIPTNLGFWPMISTRVKAFDDSQLPDGVMVSTNTPGKMGETVKSMNPPTSNYLPMNYISTAALMHDFGDWIHPLSYNVSSNGLEIGGGDGGGDEGPGGFLDISSMNLSIYLDGSYTASPWVGGVSAGSSGGRNFAEVVNPPSAGSLLNGYRPATFDGTNDRLANATTASNFVTAAYSGVILINNAAFTTGQGSTVYNEAAIMMDTAGYWGVFTGNDVANGRVKLYHYNGGSIYDQATLTGTGVWTFIKFKYSGTRLFVAVNDNAFGAGVAATTPDVTGGTLRMGFGTSNVHINASVMTFLLAPEAWTDQTFADVLDSLRNKYGI